MSRETDLFGLIPKADTIVNVLKNFVEKVILKRVTKIIYNQSYKLNNQKYTLDCKEIQFLYELFGKSDYEILKNFKIYCASEELEMILKKYEDVYYNLFRSNFYDDVRLEDKNPQATINCINRLLKKF